LIFNFNIGGHSFATRIDLRGIKNTISKNLKSQQDLQEIIIYQLMKLKNYFTPLDVIYLELIQNNFIGSCRRHNSLSKVSWKRLIDKTNLTL
jgi:hypothetical protein